MMIYSKNINQAFFKISTTNNCKDMKKKSMPKEVISTLFFFYRGIIDRHIMILKKLSFGRKLQYTRNNYLNLESLICVFRNHCGFMLHCLSELNSNLRYLVYFQNRLRSYLFLAL